MLGAAPSVPYMCTLSTCSTTELNPQFCNKFLYQGSKMVQGKGLATKPDDLSLVPRTHLVKEES